MVISPAIVGPFDLGVITVRTALDVDPGTAQGEAFSDPFPQIFQGIPVRIRDIRLKLDRPGFTLDPTSCAVKQITSHVTGTGGNLASTADDTGADLSSRFQAADCAALGFAPKLSMRLRGDMKRGGTPALRATVSYPKRGAYANIAAAKVTLPHSEFLDNAHIQAPCTRVRFAEGGGFGERCPTGSVLGSAVAKTPLFDFPLQGPVFLRSSSHKLPDLVAVLRGPAQMPVAIELDGRIDAVRGRIRNSFELVPDAPVEEFTLSLQGGKKGLLENSPPANQKSLCESKNFANARFIAQNGRVATLRPKLKLLSCEKRHKAHRGRGRRSTLLSQARKGTTAAPSSSPSSSLAVGTGEGRHLRFAGGPMLSETLDRACRVGQ